MIRQSNEVRIAELAALRETQELENFLIYLELIKVKYETKVKMGSEQINEMFSIYRDYFGRLEYGTHCPSCRMRVYDELQYCRHIIEKEIAKRYE